MEAEFAGVDWRMSTQLRLLATAIVFYTRIPLRLWFDYSPDYQNRATRYLPAVGLLVGGAGANTIDASGFSASNALVEHRDRHDRTHPV